VGLPICEMSDIQTRCTPYLQLLSSTTSDDAVESLKHRDLAGADLRQ